MDALESTQRLPRRRLCATLGLMPLSGLAGWLSGCAGVAAPNESGVPPYRLVDRVSWGANDSELERAARLGYAGYLQAQFAADGDAALPTGVQQRIEAMTSLRQPLLEALVEVEALRRAGDAAPDEDARKIAREAYQKDLARRAREAAQRHLLRALYAPAQLREQMVWFWLNHFNVHQHKANLRAMLAHYEETALRPQALGDFRAMLGAVARHPAMLRYLDNEHNAAGRGNENFARELLELHTLGVDGGYTQRDVQELARVLTGHGIQIGERPKLRRELEGQYLRQGAYEFNPARHDHGDKQILGHTIRGRGAAELDEVLDLLAQHPATARHLCRRIATFLVADPPPPALVQRMVTAFQGGRIDAALGVLLRAPELLDAGPTFKDPLRFVLSALRAAYDDRVIRNTVPIQNWLNRLGEGLYNRATPDGYPLDAAAWNGSGQLAVRFEVARAIGSGSAGLFRTEDPGGADEPAFPQLARGAYYAQLRATLREPTRQALAGAATPQEWNTLYLASPDFMVR